MLFRRDHERDDGVMSGRRARAERRRDGRKPKAGHDQGGMRPAFDGSGLYPLLMMADVEITPVVAAAATIHQSMAGRPAGTCVTTCATLARGLAQLGIKAQAVSAYAEVKDIQDPQTSAEQVGVQEQPVLRPDGTTNGHMVVWVDDCSRLVDPTIAQAPNLLAAARRDPRHGLPSIVPVTDKAALFAGEPVAVIRDRFQVNWLLQPGWTSLLEQLLTGDSALAVDYGAGNLAVKTLETLQILREHRDLNGLPDRYPRLGNLLAGREHLPPLPVLTTGAAALLGL
jgi:hypothetical protein